MSKPRRARSMREKERTVQALAGRRFPKLGDTGVYTTSAQLHATVVVTRMSADGCEITVRFLGAVATRLYGAFRVLTRRSEESDGGAIYACLDFSHGGPHEWGWVQF